MIPLLPRGEEPGYRDDVAHGMPPPRPAISLLEYLWNADFGGAAKGRILADDKRQAATSRRAEVSLPKARRASGVGCARATTCNLCRDKSPRAESPAIAMTCARLFTGDFKNDGRRRQGSAAAHHAITIAAMSRPMPNNARQCREGLALMPRD